MPVFAQELISRTGRSPHYSYLSLGCSKAAERAMLAYARRAVGKPFSGMAMARAVLWPRQTTGENYFCAELVAAILQEGGLLDRSSNPGGATPQSLYTLYVSRAASTANPYALKQLQQHMAQQTAQQQMMQSGLSASMAQALAHAAPHPTTSYPTPAHPHPQAPHVGGSLRPPCDRPNAATGNGGNGGGVAGAAAAAPYAPGWYPLLSADPPSGHAPPPQPQQLQSQQRSQHQLLQTPPRPTPVLQNHRGAPSSACAHLANALAVAGAGAPTSATARRYHGRGDSPPRQRFKPLGVAGTVNPPYLAHVAHAAHAHAHAPAPHPQPQVGMLSMQSLNFAKPRGA